MKLPNILKEILTDSLLNPAQDETSQTLSRKAHAALREAVRAMLDADSDEIVKHGEECIEILDTFLESFIETQQSLPGGILPEEYELPDELRLIVTETQEWVELEQEQAEERKSLERLLGIEPRNPFASYEINLANARLTSFRSTIPQARTTVSLVASGE